MTKTLTLQRDVGTYKFEGGPIICSRVLSEIVKLADEITLTISTEPLPNAQRVLVCKGGYYRWNWSIPEWKQSGGMYLHAEETLNRIFPDARTDGLDQPKEVWLYGEK